MNCKPGILAFVVNATIAPENNGRIVRVVRRVIPGERLPLPDGTIVRLHTNRTADWIVESNNPITYVAGGKEHAVTVRPYGDKYLRPLRDPGDDAVDESKAWLPPVPTTTKELA